MPKIDITPGLTQALFAAAPDGREEQFYLARMQTFNWGTFSDLSDHAIAKEGFLFVGPSGSGKSTLLDGHAALLTPPKWVDFNVAAREAEKGGRDRSLITYVRGAWAQQTTDNDEQVSRYLRKGTTWSAIAETYRNGLGKVVVLVRVLWLRGATTANSDVKGQYLVAEREFDLKELKFFAESDFDVRKLRAALDDVFIKDEFSAYQDRFRHLLGIKNERALRLLHKTQSAKNLGGLNEFLRDFMLDPPETFVVADTLVKEFRVLDEAHEAVLAARNQIATLKPAQEDHAAREKARSRLLDLKEERVAVNEYREHRRRDLLTAAIAELAVQAEGSLQSVQQLQAREAHQKALLSELETQRRGQGGDLIARLEADLEERQRRKPLRLAKSELAAAACRALELAAPQNPHQLAQAKSAAQDHLARRAERTDDLERRMDVQKAQNALNEARFLELRAEIEAMEKQASNIPLKMLRIREQLSRDLKIPDDKLPFAGELMEVKPSDKAWTGAVERVLKGLATSLLVDERHYAQVASYVNELHLGGRIVYLRMMPHSVGQRALSPNSIVKKLNFKPGPHQEWLREQVKAQYADFECVETAALLRSIQRGVTLTGQVKHNSTRHEKNDQFRVDDRDQWVLGYDNTEKKESYKRQASDLALTLAGAARALTHLRKEGEEENALMLQCQTLVNLVWEEIDIASLLADITSTEQRLAAERTARPELAQLDEQIQKHKDRLEKAASAASREVANGLSIAKEAKKHQDRLDGLPAPTMTLTPFQRTSLDRRYGRIDRDITLDSLDRATTEVVNALSGEEQGVVELMASLKARIETGFSEFNRNWPAESGGLDAKLESAPDYFAKLDRLERDGLDRFVSRFMQLLRDQSDQNLSVLHAKLEGERKSIMERLEQVNESLRGAPYNPGTYLAIKPQDRMTDQVREFRQQLRDALSHSLKDDDQVEAERRFAALNAVVQRIGSQDAADLKWRNLVLDVRQHVEFLAREFDENDKEVESYSSGAGKSGGQRQKLTATCLAAALRYQLGGLEQPWPIFSTVVMDEAFDKADADFTRMMMDIFKTFGFQMVVATPLKGVMTLEPFIGGACYIHIRDRKHSEAMVISYDKDNSRLDLPLEAQQALAAEEAEDAAIAE